MSDLLTLVLAAFVAAVLIALGWWLLIESEGVYLGRRVVIWLYDLTAGRYDDIKHFRQEYDHMYLAQPIMERAAAVGGQRLPFREPLILDVATGTGRLPLAMLRHQHYRGRVIGIDLSGQMLRQAARRLLGAESKAGARSYLVWGAAETLPFPDASFHVVTCLEALEFMERPQSVLRELVRVLQPGGILLITNRLTGRWMPGKTWTEDELRALLHNLGVERVEFDPWQVDYIRVWGRKRSS